MSLIPVSRYFTLLAHYLRPQRGRFALLALCLLAGIVLQVIIPQVSRGVIDLATTVPPATAADQPDPAADQLTVQALAFIGLALVQQVVSLSTTALGERVAWTATNALRSDVLAHVLRLDMTFHQATNAGTLIERVDGDISQLAEFFSQFFIRIVGSLLLAGGILIALFLEDSRAGLVYTLFAGAALFVLYRLRGVAIEPARALREIFARLSGFIEEHLGGMEDLRANGAGGYVIDRLGDIHQEIRRRWSRTVLYNSLFQSTSGMILTAGFSVAFVTGALLYEQGALTLGGVYLLMNYVILLNRPLTDLSNQVERLQTISASVSRVNDLLETHSALPQVADTAAQIIPAGALDVAFDSVTFGYAPDQPVLRQIAFRLPPGETLGVVGRTGSGKSTLARLIFRLYDPQEGRVTLSGVPLTAVRLSDLRRRVAVVTQEVQLFEGAVRDNLTFFDPTIDDAQIIATLNSLELEAWLRELPDGLETRIGSGGQGLSAGQAQLLAFARAMLRQPDLVILDEASSRLDPLTEARIERAVDHLLHGRTGILIAHRLATLDRVDRILVLEGGSVVEIGSRAALAADPASRFAGLLRLGEGALS
ncbi:MAG: ABC transporter ATP-binding protein [Anaerolineae bacterium]|nr:ABC transporter ATP-binding protein [Anaerolineae bacterium]